MNNKLIIIWKKTWIDFKSVLPYLLVSVVIGAFIYESFPNEFFQKYVPKDSLWSVPIASVIGIPLYMRVETMIPICMSFLAKGVSMGVVIALIIGSGGASLTEVLLLRIIFKKQIIIAFLFSVLFMAIFTGYMIDFIL